MNNCLREKCIARNNERVGYSENQNIFFSLPSTNETRYDEKGNLP